MEQSEAKIAHIDPIYALKKSNTFISSFVRIGVRLCVCTHNSKSLEATRKWPKLCKKAERCLIDTAKI